MTKYTNIFSTLNSLGNSISIFYKCFGRIESTSSCLTTFDTHCIQNRSRSFVWVSDLSLLQFFHILCLQRISKNTGTFYAKKVVFSKKNIDRTFLEQNLTSVTPKTGQNLGVSSFVLKAQEFLEDFSGQWPLYTLLVWMRMAQYQN